MALTLEQLFDEEWYLAENPRIAEAVANGRLSSGLFHFSRFGQFESIINHYNISGDCDDVSIAGAENFDNFAAVLASYLLEL